MKFRTKLVTASATIKVFSLKAYDRTSISAIIGIVASIPKARIELQAFGINLAYFVKTINRIMNKTINIPLLNMQIVSN